MSILKNNIEAYAASATWTQIPDSIQAFGEITGPDGNTLVSIAFHTHRDIINEIGYSAPASCPEELRACAACVCELAKDKAVMAAELIGPAEIASLLTDDGNLDDQTFYFALVSILALKNALSSYASYRTNDFKSWKSMQKDSSNPSDETSADME